MRPAFTLASIAAASNVGPTVERPTTSTGTGRAPARIRSASSFASSSVKPPVMMVSPPVIPSLQAMSSTTWGLEITRSSKTMATRLFGSPIGAQAASPVRRAHSADPSRLNSISTCHPPVWGSITAIASFTAAPVRVGGPRRSAAPSSSSRVFSPEPAASSGVGTGPGVGGGATASTGRNSSCAVLPITSSASWGSVSPGSSTMILRSPVRCRFGSATPSWSTRLRSTSRVRSTASSSALCRGLSLASSTICVPPRRRGPGGAGGSG